MASPIYTVNGQPVSQVACGTAIEFDVPGYSQVWLMISQNSRTSFNDIINVPMPPYRLRCPEDVGDFVVWAYQITPQGARGNAIGSTHLTVTATAESPPYVPPIIPATTASGTPPPMGSGSVFTPQAPIDIGGGPPIQFVEPGEPQQAGMLFGMDLTTLVLFGIAALVLLPPLFKQRR